MALEKLGSDATWGIAFLVSAGIVDEIIAKACSSPQTTELNADSRAPTLMKWVYIGMAEAAAFVAVAAWLDRKHRVPIIIGGLAAGVITWAEYVHARAVGLASAEPGTETTSGAQSPGSGSAGKGLAW